jgi:hypothetical protein
MSLAEHVSRPFPVFAKLAVMLRNIPAVKFVYARWAAWLRAETDLDSSAPLDRKLLEEAPVIAPDPIEQPVAALEWPGGVVIAAPEPHDLCVGEQPLERRLVEATSGVAPDAVESPAVAELPVDIIVATPEPIDLRESEQPLERRLVEEASGVAPDAVESPAVAELPVDIIVAAPEPIDLRESEQPLERRLVEAAPGIAPDAVEPPATRVELAPVIVVAEPQPDPRSERELLIRRRWAETGSKMWNADFHGAGGAALNIQGSVALLPAKPGGNLPRYDKLEFRQVGGQIVCEGVVLDPPKRRR